MYNKHFVCLIFVGCHNLQKYFNTKIYTWKFTHEIIWHDNFPNYGLSIEV